MSKGRFSIETQEIDSTKPNHIHLLIKFRPDCSISYIVHDLKQYTTFYLWKEETEYLKKFYWKRHELWTRGYFCSTIGSVSEKTLRKYIDEQG